MKYKLYEWKFINNYLVLGKSDGKVIMSFNLVTSRFNTITDVECNNSSSYNSILLLYLLLNEI